MIEVLPNINKTIQVVGSGNSGTLVGVEKPYLVHDKPPVKSGIGYLRSRLWSGQTTSYFIGDEGWRWQQGEFDDVNIENCEYIQSLDFDSVNPFVTLKNPNKFGGYERFTDFEGLQNYPDAVCPFLGFNFAYQLIIDNLYNVIYSSRRIDHAYVSSIPQGLVRAFNYSTNGYSDFRVAGITQLNTISNIGLGDNLLNYFPFSINIGSTNINTSTFKSSTNVNVYYVKDFQVGVRGVNDILNYIFCKNLD
jgi:hypothetical protein